MINMFLPPPPPSFFFIKIIKNLINIFNIIDNVTNHPTTSYMVILTEKLRQNYSQLHKNKNIIDIGAFDIIQNIPKEYEYLNILIKSENPFLKIIFNKGDALIATAYMYTKTEFGSCERGEPIFDVFLNDQKINYSQDLEKIIQGLSFIENKKNIFTIFCKFDEN